METTPFYVYYFINKVIFFLTFDLFIKYNYILLFLLFLIILSIIWFIIYNIIYFYFWFLVIDISFHPSNILLWIVGSTAGSTCVATISLPPNRTCNFHCIRLSPFAMNFLWSLIFHQFLNTDSVIFSFMYFNMT